MSPTLGQIAYEAWHASIIPALFADYAQAWSQVPALEQRAWDAAAQAVLEAFVSSAMPVPLPEERP